MKRISIIILALVLVINSFAALSPAPDDQTLQGYKTDAGQNLVYAIYVEDSIKCNDIVLTGTYNGWAANAGDCSKFVAVNGFDGWYVCCVTDASETIQAKPVQLTHTGAFNWDYMVGAIDQGDVIRGTATIVPGYSNESDINNIGDDAPLLINVTKWKNNPCTAKFHDYVITLISPDCNAEEFITPAISGGFNSWLQEAMTMDSTATFTRQKDGLPGAIFKVTAHAAEGSQYKFRSAASWGADWSNELKQYNAVSGEWEAFNGGAIFTFGASIEIEYDLGDPTKYSWTSCNHPIQCDSMDYTIVVKFPACEATTPNVIGSFCGWNGGVTMTPTGNPSEYTATVRALCTDEFKFNDAVLGWDNTVMLYKGLEWQYTDDLQFGTEHTIIVDYSSNKYCWKACLGTEPQTNTVITYTASKKLPETTSSTSDGLHTNAFNVSVSSHTFSNGTGTITFSGEVTTVGEYAFYNSTSLTSITIPSGVTSIGNDAFSGCFDLASVSIPNSVTSIGNNAFTFCMSLTSVNIPDCITRIEPRTFWNATSLQSITIPKSVTFIGEDAFNGCSSLTSIIIPNSVTNIDKLAFYQCKSLKSISLGNGLSNIGDFAFAYCAALTSIIIPSSVVSIGSMSFSSCSSLKSVTIHSQSVMNASMRVLFYNSPVREYIIGNEIRSIGAGSFSECTNISSITIPNSVTSIGDKAFYGCTKLTRMDFPSSVTALGKRVCASCTNLEMVTLGSGITKIDSYAFQDNKALTKVICYAINPPVTTTDAFDYRKAILYVPCESKLWYKISAMGYQFANIACVDEKQQNAVNSNGPERINSVNSIKFIRNGQLFIKQNGRTYNVQGVEIE